MRLRALSKHLLAAIAGSLAAACGLLSNEVGNTGVGIPTPAQIATYYKATAEGMILDSSGRRITVGEYLLASLTYTNEKCHLFFERLEAFRQDSQFLDQVLTAAVASGSPLLALSASVSKEAVANVTSGLAAANLLNKRAGDIYAFATYKESLKTHVFEALADFQAKKGLDILTQARYGVYVYTSEDGSTATVTLNTEPPRSIRIDKRRAAAFIDSDLPMDIMIARSMATDYAAICSLANMRRIVAESLAVTKTIANTTGNPSAPTTTKTKAIEPGF